MDAYDRHHAPNTVRKGWRRTRSRRTDRLPRFPHGKAPDGWWWFRPSETDSVLFDTPEDCLFDQDTDDETPGHRGTKPEPEVTGTAIRSRVGTPAGPRLGPGRREMREVLWRRRRSQQPS